MVENLNRKENADLTLDKNKELQLLKAENARLDQQLNGVFLQNKNLYANTTLNNISETWKQSLKKMWINLPELTPENQNKSIIEIIQPSINQAVINEVIQSPEKNPMIIDAVNIAKQSNKDILSVIDNQKKEALQLFDQNEKPLFRKEIGGLKTDTLIAATNLNKETWSIDINNIIQLPIMENNSSIA